MAEDFILESLLNGSSFRLRILRFFFYHLEQSFSVSEVAKSINIKKSLANKEFKQLQRIGFLKKVGKKSILNSTFVFLEGLRNLFSKTSPIFRQEIKKEIIRIAPVKMLVFSGIFFGEAEAELDLLVVAEKFNSRKLEKLLVKLEKYLGRPINYSLMNRKEFEYRWGMFDRFLQDVFEGDYEIAVNKIGFEGL